MFELLLVIAAIFCAFEVMRAQRLLLSTLWLAVTSALVSILLFRLGAPDVAVIELSVGAGLVTVLFVFAFSIVGEDTLDDLSLVPRPLVWSMILLVSVILGWYILPISTTRQLSGELPFSTILWQLRGLDVFAQIILIFAGVMGLLGLLSEAYSPLKAWSVPVAITQPGLPTSETLGAVPGAAMLEGEILPPEKEVILEELHT